MSAPVLLWWLVVGHVVMDYWAQSDALAVAKNRHRNKNPYFPWQYALTAHAIMHGAAVAYLTQSIALGLIETAAHWLIDCGKNEDYYNIHVDQALHLLCKVAYVIYVVI